MCLQKKKKDLAQREMVWASINLNLVAASLQNVRIELVCVGLIRTVSRYTGGCFRGTGIYG